MLIVPKILLKIYPSHFKCQACNHNIEVGGKGGGKSVHNKLIFLQYFLSFLFEYNTHVPNIPTRYNVIRLRVPGIILGVPYGYNIRVTRSNIRGTGYNI